MKHLRKIFESSIDINSFLIDLKSMGCNISVEELWIDSIDKSEGMESTVVIVDQFFYSANNEPKKGYTKAFKIKIYLEIKNLETNSEFAKEILELNDRLSDIGKVNFGITTNTSDYRDWDVEEDYIGVEYSFAVITNEIFQEMNTVSKIEKAIYPYLKRIAKKTISSYTGDPMTIKDIIQSHKNTLQILMPHPSGKYKTNKGYWKMMGVESKLVINDLNKIINPIVSKLGWKLKIKKSDNLYDLIYWEDSNGKTVLKYSTGTYLKLIFGEDEIY